MSSGLVLLTSPLRAINTASGGGGIMTPGSYRTVDLSAHGVPVGASAALISLQSFQQTGRGYGAAQANGVAFGGPGAWLGEPQASESPTP